MGAFFQELFQTRLYKRTQGRVARQVTAAALGIIAAIGAWRLSAYYGEEAMAFRFGVPTPVLAFFAWVAYCFVNLPSFADFLISVEAEMNKVSWPSREIGRAHV